MARPEKIRIGNLLVQEKMISQEQLSLALEQQKRSGRKLGRVLIENGFATEEAISEALAKQLKIPYLNLKFYNVNLSVARTLPEMQARRFRALLLEDKGNSYLVAMADPTDLFAYDEISRLLKRDIELVLVNENQVLETMDRVYRRTEQMTDLARELGADMAESVDFGALSIEPGAEDAPVVKLLQTMFEDATQVNASDVHIEPQENLLQIRFRIDGMLQLQTESDSKIAPALVQRLKLMSDWTSPKNACRRTAASMCAYAKHASTCAFRPCPRNTANRWRCACSTAAPACRAWRVWACRRNCSRACNRSSAAVPAWCW
jgi:MSHA biogenesis protein MshE